MADFISISPLKFYNSKEKWLHARDYSFGKVSPLLMHKNFIDPFQICVNDRGQNVHIPEDVEFTFVYFDNSEKDGTKKVKLAVSDEDFKFVFKNGKTVVQYLGNRPLDSVNLPEGLAFVELKIVPLNMLLYSEVFNFSSSLEPHIILTYRNPESDFVLKNGFVSFANNFKFKMRVMAELGRPEYNFEEEATKRLGYNFIESQVSKKVYKFNAIMPEYMCDALRLVRLCSSKSVSTSDGDSYEAISFDMDVDWQDQGDLANVKCEFETDNIIVNLGGYTETSDAFNNDFNNDFS